MNTDGNLNALNKYENEVDKTELILEHEQNEPYDEIRGAISEINHIMKVFAMDSVMDKQEILEYVKETLNELLEIK